MTAQWKRRSRSRKSLALATDLQGPNAGKILAIWGVLRRLGQRNKIEINKNK